MDRMSLERHGTWATIGGSVLAAGVALALGFPAIAGRVGEQNWWKHPDVIIGMSVSVVGAGIVLAVAADMLIPRQQPLVVEYVQHKTTLQQAEGRFEAYQLANSVGLAWRSAPPEAVCTIGGDASTVTLKVALGDLTCAYPTDFPGVEPTTGSLSVSWLARRREVGEAPLLPPLDVVRGLRALTHAEQLAGEAWLDEFTEVATLSVKIRVTRGGELV